MKLAISCYPTIGGSGIVASELGMALADRGHEVHFISYAVPSRLDVLKPRIHAHTVTVPDYPLFEYPPYSLALASKLSEVVKRENLQIIHAHYAIPHAASALLASEIIGRDKLKVVTTLHGTDITLVGRNDSFLPVTKYSIEQSDAVSAVSEFLKKDICRIFTCDKEISVIYNFVNPKDFEGLNGRKLRKTFTPNGEKLLVHASNFRPVKRVQDVVKVFLGVREQMPVKLVLIGSGPELPAVEHAICQAGAEKDLINLGNRNRVLEIISAADILLQPSETESFGLTSLEAMACGVPPIASKTGGLTEVIEDGKTGYLLPVGDTAGMTKVSLELLNDRNLYSKMADAAVERAFEKFNIETALDAYERLYQTALM